MKRFLYFMILGLFLFAASCAKVFPSASDVPKATKYAQIYIIALESIMPLDDGLNGEMQYIAIDTKGLEGATAEDKTAVLKYFEKYKVKVMDESMESLEAKGMVKEGRYLEGILLRINSLVFASDTEVSTHITKYRSGKGAVGAKSIIKYKGGKWTLDSTKGTWVS